MSLVLTMVLKLKPKSRPVISAAPMVMGATVCAVPLMPALKIPVLVLKALPLPPLPASASAGLLPPTKSLTATALPLAAVVR